MVDFYVDGELSIIAICSANMDNNDYTIRLWAPLETSKVTAETEEFNSFIFKISSLVNIL